MESNFYKLLAIQAEDIEVSLGSIKRDMFDASKGPQAGLTADGNVAILMVVNQPTAKMVLDGFDAVLDHSCVAGQDCVNGYMMYTHTLLHSILPRLDCEIQSTQFFEHGEASD